MPYFLSDENLAQGKIVSVVGEEARHILLAHRKKKGEKVKLQGPDGKRYGAEIVEINRNILKLKVLEQAPVPAEPKISITLFQSVVSEKALDFIFQKGTELGLNKIVLFNSANTATKLSADQFKKKQERWNKILTEAAKQCERAKYPGLEFVLDVKQAVVKMEVLDKVFLTDISGQKLNVKGQMSNVAVIIGPEGGFTDQEMQTFKTLPNLKIISLGPILLRAETAALASIAIIQNLI